MAGTVITYELVLMDAVRPEQENTEICDFL